MSYGTLYLTGDSNVGFGEALDRIFEAAIKYIAEDPARFLPFVVFYVLGLTVQKKLFKKELQNNTKVKFNKIDWPMALIYGIVLFLISASVTWVVCMMLSTASFSINTEFFNQNLGTITILPGLFCGIRIFGYALGCGKTERPTENGDGEAARLKDKMKPLVNSMDKGDQKR